MDQREIRAARREEQTREEQLCDFCRRIDLVSLFTDPLRKRQETLQAFNDILNCPHCTLCRLISNAVAPVAHWLLPNGTNSRLYLSSGAHSCVDIFSFDTNGRVGELHLVKRTKDSLQRSSTVNSKEFYRNIAKLSWASTILNGSSNAWSSRIPIICRRGDSREGRNPYNSSESNQVDFSVFRRAINHCETNHGQFCNNFKPGDRPNENMRLFLVDVKQKCLVKAWANCTYVSLSYVWGKVEMLQTTKANLTELQKKGALDRRQSEIPRVIRDAMEVVNALGMKHLWVDTLCIVQDDDRNKHSQIARMNIIYTCARLTLVALHGKDANAALRGATCPSTKNVEEMYGLHIVAIPPALSPLLKASYYNTRSWTFQEQVLSNRCLYFTERQIYYQCCSSICCEDGVSREGLNSRIDLININPLIETHINSNPDSSRSSIKFYVYQTLVEEYTRKNLTYASDILNAFAGIIAAHEPVYGKFVIGLPESVIDLALLWISVGLPQRRKVPSSEKGLEAYAQPSWSWAGWNGAVYHPVWPFRQPPEETTCTLKSLVQSVQTLSKDQKTLRTLARHEALTPREEIQQHENNEVKTVLTSKNVMSSSISDKTLFFWAWTAPLSLIHNTDFHVADEVSLKMKSQNVTATRLFQGQQPCGLLFGGTLRSILTATNATLDLVLLSENEGFHFREKSIDFWYCLNIDTSMFPKENWCILNVILVRWNGNNAERVAVGMIHRGAWMKATQNRKFVQLV